MLPNLQFLRDIMYSEPKQFLDIFLFYDAFYNILWFQDLFQLRTLSSTGYPGQYPNSGYFLLFQVVSGNIFSY